MKITLAICTNRGIRPKTAQALLEMVHYSKEHDLHIVVAERGYTTGENRNYSVVQAEKNGSDYLLFIDDDMTFLPSTLEELLAHEVDVVGVNSYSRCLPLSSTVGLMDKEGKYMSPDNHTAWEMRIPTKLFKAYFVGAGIMLIDMKVFKKIEKPYFVFTTDENGQIVNGEDGYFCDKVKKAGMEVWCDPEIEVGHLGEYEFKKPAEEFSTFVENTNKI
jgi:glycosyltransferase involved in cell wall biosynthesis